MEATTGATRATGLADDQGAAGARAPGGRVPSARVAELMGRMAAGDGAAVVAFTEECGTVLAALVRRSLGHRGVRGVDRAELDGLVLDAALALAEVAGAWHPEGGAAPWSWGRHRIERVVDRWVGQHAVALDAAIEGVGGAAPPRPGAAERPPVEVLEGLARHDPRCRILSEALGEVASARDGAVFLECGVQEVMGDRGAAATVAPLYGMTPAAVRQARCRTRRRLLALAARDERYAELAALPLVAA